jgi:hypothetical protein
MQAEMKGDVTNPMAASAVQGRHPAGLLLAVPLLVYGIWLIVVYLLEGARNPFGNADSTGIVLYTLCSCILVGTIVPVLVIRRTFTTGAVNMYQLGFRTRRRTVLMVVLTVVCLYTAFLLGGSFGNDRSAFFSAFLLILPTAIASVMVCWVLCGTHLQALVRGGGAPVAIITGVAGTSLLFAVASAAHSPLLGGGAGVSAWFLPGIIAALFFFAVRDVYATAIVVAGCSAFILAGGYGQEALPMPSPVLWSCSLLGVMTLAGVHLYFSRHYTTIRLD